jgi:hypothetical protein
MKKALSVLGMFFVGCASIVHQTTQQVPVKSEPAGAAITVACGDVYNDPKLVTPAVVTVHRKPNHCSISLAKSGYQPASVSLKKTMSGWYAGNILFGGIIGLIVDAANGAMNNRTPAAVDVTLSPATEGTSSPNSLE